MYYLAKGRTEDAVIFSRIDFAHGPDTRTTAIPALPLPDDRA